MSKETPACVDAVKWLRANGHSLAPLTGTDYRSLRAMAHVWDLYAYTGSSAVLSAARAIAEEMQASTRHLARELIARSMEWGDRDRIWPLDGTWPSCSPTRSRHEPDRIGG